ASFSTVDPTRAAFARADNSDRTNGGLALQMAQSVGLPRPDSWPSRLVLDSIREHRYRNMVARHLGATSKPRSNWRQQRTISARNGASVALGGSPSDHGWRPSSPGRGSRVPL